MSNTVKHIESVADRPIIICLGGGIDSEVVAREFLNQNIKFTALTIKQKDLANKHDTDWADKFCKEHNIEQIYHEFDPEVFFTTKIHEYRKQGYVSRRPWRYFQIYLIELVESLGGCGIICSGEQIYKTVNNEICSSFSSEYVLAIEYCRRNNLVHFPYFHLQNSELLAAYMKTDIVDLLLSNPDNYRSVKFNNSLEKILVCHRYYPDMPRREKYDGFEKSSAYHKFIQKHRILYPNFVDYNMPVSLIKQQLGIK